MNKRILLISDIDSVYTKRYVERVLLPDGWEIVIAPIWKQSGKYDDWLANHGITVYHDTHRLPVIRHIPKLRMRVRTRANAKSLQALGPFDAIHNHYLSSRDLALGKAVQRRFPTARWAASFWGSDLLRSTPEQLHKMAPFLRACDKITVISQPHIVQIQSLFGAECAQKTTVCDFGVDVYDVIDVLRKTSTRSDCKTHFGLPAEQPLICLGYNASAPHRHLELLKALAMLPDKVLASWSIILQMTYGSTDTRYLEAVRTAAAQLSSKTMILTEFMDDTECAYLRLAADAFVLAMPTDAFSSSLQEYLYAGAQVLCGSWLTYPQLDRLDIRPIPFQTIAQVPALLQKALAQPVPAEQLQKRALLRERYSWAALLADWRSLYR